MITGSEIYWITRLDAVNLVFGVAGAAGCIVCLIALVIWAVSEAEEDDDVGKAAGWVLKCIMPITIIALLAFAFTPTMKEMCAIKAIPLIVNNGEVQKMPEKVVQLANEWIDELRPETETKSAGDGKKAPMDSSP